MQLDPAGLNFQAEFRALVASDLPEAEKIARAFGALTQRVIESARGQVELAHALGDREAKIKQQILLETMEHARSIYRLCHRQITGVSAWDERGGAMTEEGGPR